MHKLSLASQRVARDFRLQILLLAGTRIVIVVARVILLFTGGGPTDLSHFLSLSHLTDQGLYPYLHFWMEYPPVFPWVAVAVYRFTTLFGPGLVAAALFHILLNLLLVSCELGIFVIIHRLGLLVGNSESATRGTLVYLACTLPIYIWNGWFDPLPTLLFLSGLYLLLTGRERLSAVGIGLGIMSKVFPGLLVPLAMCILPTFRRKVGYALIVSVVVLVIALPFAIAGPTMLVASARNMFGRPSWESFWAILEGYYWYGEVAPVSLRTDPGAALVTSHPSTIPWLPITAVFGMLFAGFYWRFWGTVGRRPWSSDDRRRVVAAAGFTLALLLLYFRGYSPQFLCWLTPLVALLYPNRQGAVYSLVLTLMNVIELIVYFSLFPDQHWLLVLAVLGRTVMWILISWECLLGAFSARPPLLWSFGGRRLVQRQSR